MNYNSIPGWTINIVEISIEVYKVTFIDVYGRKVEIIDIATGETIEKAIATAFDIEKQISKNWNLFLYVLTVQKLSDKDIKHKEYIDKAYGSWYIEGQDKRLVYDGKDAWLIFQTKTKDDWTDELMTKFQGKGIMKEASKKVIDYAFQTMQFQRIVASTHKENRNSTKLLEKFDFKKSDEADKENPELNIYILINSN